MDVFEGNFCKFFFTSITLAMIGVGTLMNLCEPYLPALITRTFRYGKFASTEDSKLVRTVEVPKSYFRHFYLASTLIYSPIALHQIVTVYVFGKEPSTWVIAALNLFYGTRRLATVNATRVFLAVSLLVLQVIRRFYDTHFVSVFSKTATINFSHYFIGMVYYPAVFLVIFGEAPKFALTKIESQLRWSDVGVVEIGAVILFLWAWYNQHRATVILANLRKNKKGDVVSQGYNIPAGGWFDYLSSPHCTAEVLIYTALTLLLRGNSGWWFAYAWVISNQVETILLSHWWYQSHFDHFPRHKKALVPFIY